MNAFRQRRQPPMLASTNNPRVPHQRVPMGIWISSANPLMAETIGHAGFRSVGLGTDRGLLAHAARAALTALRRPDSTIAHTLAVGTHAY